MITRALFALALLMPAAVIANTHEFRFGGSPATSIVLRFDFEEPYIAKVSVVHPSGKTFQIAHGIVPYLPVSAEGQAKFLPPEIGRETFKPGSPFVTFGLVPTGGGGETHFVFVGGEHVCIPKISGDRLAIRYFLKDNHHFLTMSFEDEGRGVTFAAKVGSNQVKLVREEFIDLKGTTVTPKGLALPGDEGLLYEFARFDELPDARPSATEKLELADEMRPEVEEARGFGLLIARRRAEDGRIVLRMRHRDDLKFEIPSDLLGRLPHTRGEDMEKLEDLLGALGPGVWVEMPDVLEGTFFFYGQQMKSDPIPTAKVGEVRVWDQPWADEKPLQVYSHAEARTITSEDLRALAPCAGQLARLARAPRS